MRKLMLLLALAACGGPEEQAPDEQAHTEHVHHAMFGGKLVPLGDHAANLEVLHDGDEGTITVYALDAHASNTVRLKAASMKVAIEVGGKRIDLTLKAVADPLSGETAGDSACFEAQSDALEGATRFTGTIAEVGIHGRSFKNVAFSYDNKEE